MASPSSIPSYVLGAALTGFGLLALLNPKADYEIFGLPLEPAASGNNRPLIKNHASVSKGSLSPYVYAKGIRDVTYGLAYGLLQAQELDAAITTISGLVAITAFADGLIVWLCGGEKLKGKAWGHFGTAVVLGLWICWRIAKY